MKYKNLTKEAKKLIDLYCKTLNIPIFILARIIDEDKTAKNFLQCYPMLIVGDEMELLKIFIKLTLFRDGNDNEIFKPFNDEDKQVLKKYYGIEI